MSESSGEPAPKFRNVAARARLMAAAVVAVVAVATILIALNEHQRREDLRQARSGEGKARVGAPFTLTDRQGRTVANTDFRGAYVLLVFGNSKEPDRLSGPLQVVSEAVSEVLKSRHLAPGAIATVLVALDSDAATPHRLDALLSDLPIDWRGLSGAPDVITSLANAYLVPGIATHGPTKGAPPSAGTLAYLLGHDGNFIAHLAIPADAGKMASWLDKNL